MDGSVVNIQICLTYVQRLKIESLHGHVHRCFCAAEEGTYFPLAQEAVWLPHVLFLSDLLVPLYMSIKSGEMGKIFKKHEEEHKQYPTSVVH